MWNTTIIRWDFLLDLRTCSLVVCKKWRFLLETPKIGRQIFFGVYVFWLRIGVFFHISKLPSSLLHRKYLEGGYVWYKVVGGGTLQTWKPLACPTRLGTQGTMRVNLSNPFAIGLPVRKYMALDAKERGGTKVAWHKVGSPDAVKLTKKLVHRQKDEAPMVVEFSKKLPGVHFCNYVTNHRSTIIRISNCVYHYTLLWCIGLGEPKLQSGYYSSRQAAYLLA